MCDTCHGIGVTIVVHEAQVIVQERMRTWHRAGPLFAVLAKVGIHGPRRSPLYGPISFLMATFRLGLPSVVLGSELGLPGIGTGLLGGCVCCASFGGFRHLTRAPREDGYGSE
jgi:hypothetical protein